MKIKHLLILLLVLLIFYLFLPIYEYAFKMNTLNLTVLDDKYHPILIIVFSMFNCIISFYLIFLIFISTYKIISNKNIIKLLNKKIL